VLDSIRVMLRIKAIYRGRGIDTPGQGVFRPALRRDWIERVADAGARRRAEFFLAHLDTLMTLRRKAKSAMLAEARKHSAFHLLQSFPCVGPIRAAELVAIIGSPFRFRTKRNVWAYSGLAVVHESSADHLVTPTGITRRNRQPLTRGLNRNSNRTLKKVFKCIALDLSWSETPLGEAHRARLERGIRKELALLTLARSAAAILLSMWKKGIPYDPKRTTLKPQT
jgi:transposase